MQTVERSILVTYSPAQMFELVSDVARYPEFLPWCAAAHIEQATPGEQIATLRVSRGILKTEFTTRNLLTPGEQIQMQLIAGPFRDLRGAWRFEGIGSRGARVTFKIEFEFNNPVSAAAFNAVFESLCGTVVDAFAQRARQIYA